ncbi:hypothetical protein H6G81_10830 [Scytonema hofmannii FACHB-248]|uniref:SxtJ n=1 Tax=Scytonema hofmannii FACHB-248 TaxID=1842502 RepID=A0ABR8GNK9_9CYAN|nr:hypothetical protein [Scytonema hofmannii]MBD2605010.1 hypothetical protein [Scytonema hofmannii FACHB-248]
MKSFPWVSLMLVVLAYASLGWLISQAHSPWYIWLTAVIAILFLLSALTTPWLKMADYSILFFKSDTRTLAFSILAAFLFFLMLAWFKVFLDTLVIISANILLKIDVQRFGLGERQSFLITSIFSFTGLVLGALMQMAFSHNLSRHFF